MAAEWKICLAKPQMACEELDIGHYKVFCWGRPLIIDADGYWDDLYAVAEQIINRSIDFNKLHGFFKILIKDNESGELTLVGDNAGSQFFFIDEENMRVSDSLLKLKESRKQMTPDYESASRFLLESRIFTDNTLIEGIRITDKDYVYIVKNGRGVLRNSKNLTPFYEKSHRITLKDFMDACTENVGENEIRTVLTGGTDNRAVLAHLLHLKKRTACILSGRNENPDVSTAKKIASQMKLRLDIYNPDQRSENWIEEGFQFGDGIYDAVLSYRHLRLKDLACKHTGVKYIFGGVGGEFYKNDFCRFIRHRYFLRPVTPETLARDIFNNHAAVPEWFGKKAAEGMKAERKKVQKLVSVFNKGRLLCRCNSAGYLKLTKSMSAVTNNYSRYCTKIDPLMDRDIVAGASNDSAFSHCMYVWQRKQISGLNKPLSKLETDQGLTCSIRMTDLFCDWLKMMSVYARYALSKIKGKKNPEFDYWDEDYRQLSKSDLYKKSVRRCYELGLISSREPESIPLKARGRITTIGMLFDVETADDYIKG